MEDIFKDDTPELFLSIQDISNNLPLKIQYSPRKNAIVKWLYKKYKRLYYRRNIYVKKRRIALFKSRDYHGRFSK